MRTRSSWRIAALVAWTAFVWAVRIRNAVGDDSLEGWSLISPILLSASLLVPAAVVAFGWFVLGRGGRPRPRWLPAVVFAFALWTVLVWFVRGGDILFGSLFGSYHSVGFVVVHTVLAAVSIALAVAAVTGMAGSAPRQAAAASPGGRPGRAVDPG